MVVFMKYILIIMISFGSLAQSKECTLPLKSEVGSFNIFKASSNLKLEVPNGKCKLVNQDFFRENNFNCERAQETLILNKNLSTKYNCHQTASGHYRGVRDDGVPFSSFYTICYVCKTEAEELP